MQKNLLIISWLLCFLFCFNLNGTQRSGNNTRKLITNAPQNNKKETLHYFEGKRIWAKKFDIDGDLSSKIIKADKASNIYMFISYYGKLKLTNTKTFNNKKNWDLIFAKFNDKGKLIACMDLKTAEPLQIVERNNRISFFVKKQNKKEHYYLNGYSDFSNYPYTQSIQEYTFVGENEIVKKNEIKMPCHTIINDLVVDKTNNIIICGEENLKVKLQCSGGDNIEYYYKVTNAIPFITKYNTDNHIIWKKPFKEKKVAAFFNILLSSKNEFIVKEHYEENPRACPDKLRYVKFNSTGNLIKKKEIDNFWFLDKTYLSRQDHLILYFDEFQGNDNKYCNIYNTNFKLLNKFTLVKSDTADLNNFIIEQKHQTIIASCDNNEHHEYDQTIEQFKKRQHLIFKRLDTNGNLVWTKKIKQPYCIENFIETPNSTFIMLCTSIKENQDNDVVDFNIGHYERDYYLCIYK